MTQTGSLRTLLAIVLVVVLLTGNATADRLLKGTPVPADSVPVQNFVKHRCLTPFGNDQRIGGDREKPWSLPYRSLATDFDTTIHCLVLRFNFQLEETDDPNTTGLGHMDMSRPLDTLSDSAYIARNGYLIDPPPHDANYFNAHMQALSEYWETVSEGKIHLTWDIFPPGDDSVYQLPYSMSHYGACDFANVIEGLEQYFIDGISLVDTAHILDPGHPDIDFSQYQAHFMFHAGSDRQNDIGFPTTCSDLFTGFIRFGGALPVDNGTHTVRTALLMPETSIQDGRITALNAVMAHEFGHQLGLIDLYSTATFRTQLGDFALMDNNGFGTGVEFAGFTVGKVFGTTPLYPMAWSRAFLGLTDLVEIRNDTSDVRLLAAELYEQTGPKIAKVPITDKEYYLLENRITETDGLQTFVLLDSTTSVIKGPSDSTRTLTGEYDQLMPGDLGGMLIYLVDEAVA
ncbi:MAG: hypothetical protein KKA42_15120, partial [candidate division Zixibacteria bacterium]|nr:hypothetical protein [candidate division Zixibacteria bacterium]